MTLENQLKSIKARIDTMDKWCRGELAMTKDGSSVSIDSPAACKFCMIGSIAREVMAKDSVKYTFTGYELATTSDAGKLVAAVIEGRGQRFTGQSVSSTIYAFNDMCSARKKEKHAEIMSVLDEAIAYARGAGV